MVRARQKPGVWWPGRQQRHCSTKAPTCITLSRCPPRQKHEPRARRQSKSKSKTVSPPPLSDIPILRTKPPSLQPFIPHPASGTSQSRVVIRSCHLEHLCAAVPNQTKPNHRLPSPLPSPPSIRALFASHMPLTKVGPSSGRNSPAHAAKSSHFRHPFGGRVSKHFGDMVSFPAAPRFKAHTVRPS